MAVKFSEKTNKVSDNHKVMETATRYLPHKPTICLESPHCLQCHSATKWCDTNNLIKR